MNPKTPCIKSNKLSELNNCNVWLKMESSQPTGSFKQRSIGNACQQYAKRGAKKFISSSGGNAGISAAYMGNKLSIPVTVVVPETTSSQAINLMQQENAEVIVHGKSWVEANDLALTYVNSEAVYIHPFDDQYLWEGVAHIIDEVISDGVRPDAVILSVGGGSLLSGISQGLIKNLLNIPIYAVETEGTASLNTSIKTGQHAKLNEVTGIATTLAAKQVCENAFKVSQVEQVISLTVSDKEALAACFNFLDDHRTLVEPACGATLSTLYNKKLSFSPTDNILVIVCGGATVTLEQLFKYSKDLALEI
ncbi:L-serine/L-threonine ammonia-lyase [Acinetobacter pittii]|jgi:L-serine/L-threonine ammonia-lyase|nr:MULTISPECIES: pyridoxal-phosphate dependent enzyme [Acinetobacter]KQE18403.1 serine dehydratase [Acinetobacter pittii]KQE25969.1 serine dehydratase [Acinetobacter pittii]KQE50348.1 serine dehydratase [Acinetobacter pittii]KRI82741.1 serine dehydratase [Acinetobacter pittii]KRJ46744.1 serine dehydratase [Acinetobacter pittii]